MIKEKPQRTRMLFAAFFCLVYAVSLVRHSFSLSLFAAFEYPFKRLEYIFKRCEYPFASCEQRFVLMKNNFTPSVSSLFKQCSATFQHVSSESATSRMMKRIMRSRQTDDVCNEWVRIFSSARNGHHALNLASSA